MFPAAKQQANHRFLAAGLILGLGGGGWGLLNYLGICWFVAYRPELVTTAGNSYELHGTEGTVFAIVSVIVFLTIVVAFLWTASAWPFRCSKCGCQAKHTKRKDTAEFLRCTVCGHEEATGWHSD